MKVRCKQLNFVSELVVRNQMKLSSVRLDDPFREPTKFGLALIEIESREHNAPISKNIAVVCLCDDVEVVRG